MCEEAAEMLQAALSAEIEFYDFATDRLKKQAKKIRDKDHQ